MNIDYADGIAEEYALQGECHFRLSSIAYQLEECEIKHPTLTEQLRNIADIASRYSDKRGAFILLDRKIKEARDKYGKEAKNAIVTGLGFLNSDDIIFSKSKAIRALTIRGLESRVDEYLLHNATIHSKNLAKSNSRFILEETSPWEENAVRALEGD